MSNIKLILYCATLIVASVLCQGCWFTSSPDDNGNTDTGTDTGTDMGDHNDTGGNSVFITNWQIYESEYLGNTRITLPLVSNGTYDFTVDWGDGIQNNITSFDASAATHTYPEPGVALQAH